MPTFIPTAVPTVPNAGEDDDLTLNTTPAIVVEMKLDPRNDYLEDGGVYDQDVFVKKLRVLLARELSLPKTAVEVHVLDTTISDEDEPEVTMLTAGVGVTEEGMTLDVVQEGLRDLKTKMAQANELQKMEENIESKWEDEVAQPGPDLAGDDTDPPGPTNPPTHQEMLFGAPVHEVGYYGPPP
jgi:hypothetical protein